MIDKEMYIQLAYRKLAYIKIANSELLNKNRGIKHNEDLLAACTSVVKSLNDVMLEQDTKFEPKNAIM